MKVSAADIFTLVDKFQHSSELYLKTHGVHSAALCDKRNMIVFSEDIGRHNAIDKIFGKCLLEDIPAKDRAVITTGRITSEILHKVARRGIQIIISISEPTNLGIEIADNLNITLVASATTPIHTDGIKAALPYFNEAFGDPPTIYSCGQEAKGE